jgi:heterodisulfide reductase subunit A-like polyferredoxin
MLEERKRYIIDFEDIPADRARMTELAAEERIKNFEEIEKGFTPEQAQGEAQRCLSCRRCLGCKLCLAVCEKEAIDFDQMDKESEIEVDSIIITPGIIGTPEPLDQLFGYGKYPNLVTDLEFERILHPEGPYGGLVLRPSDGEMPRKVGFIYYARKQLNHHSLIFLLKEAAATRRRIEGSEIWLLSNYLFEVKNDYKSYLNHIPDLVFKTCSHLSIKEIEESRNLVVEFLEKGEKRMERFQMVIISTQLKLPDPVKILGEQLGVKLAQRVEPTEDPSARPTGKSGISVAGGIISE